MSKTYTILDVTVLPIAKHNEDREYSRNPDLSLHRLTVIPMVITQLSHPGSYISTT